MLKGLRKRLEARSERFGAANELWIRFGRGRDRSGGARFLIDELVGEEKPGEQELARFGQGAATGQRFPALAGEQARGGFEILLLAFAAGDLIGSPGDSDVDHRGHQTAACRISSSSSSTTSRTLARSSLSPAGAGWRLAKA